MEIAIIDLETTGFSPDSGDRIIEIGIVFLDEKLKQIRTFQSLVNPNRSVHNTVHGISNAELEGMPTFSELFDTLIEQLRNTACLVAHNISFERKFLRAEFSNVNFHLPSKLQEVCTMQVARELKVGSNQKLETLINELQIKLTGPSHRALPDAMATAELLRFLSHSKFTLPVMHEIEWTTDAIFNHKASGIVCPHPKKLDTDQRSIACPVVSSSRCNVSAVEKTDAVGTASEISSLNSESRSRLNINQKAGIMSNSNISRPVQILIEKLGSEGSISQKSAEALIDQARRHGSSLEDAVAQLSPYLYGDNFSVRVAVASVLGHIGTQKAIKAIAKAFESCSADELAMECNFGVWSEESLSTWFASAIGESENRVSAKALISLLSSKSLPDAAKARVMHQLGYFDLDDLNVKLPGDIVETLERFASSDDPDIAEGAISMLGKL